jgi:FAD/FMN-containing dehydrogenase/Fe-S oxidoreductase
MAAAFLAPARDTASLESELRRAIAGEVRFDAGSRALYATDASNYRQVPIGVVVPRSVDDVVATVAACARFGVPILSRGGGTSLAGQCCNVAVVMDFSKYVNRILALDPHARHAVVEPGVVLDTLREAAEQHHLTFAPDPSTHSHNTLGGMIGNNSCGVHSVMGGKTVDNVIALDVLTYDGLRMTVGATSDAELAAIIAAGGRRGEIYAALKALVDAHAEEIRLRYPRIPRRVSGYGLDELLPENGFNVARALVGTECTCVTILGAKVRLVPSPPSRSLLVLGYPDVFRAADHVPDILAHGPIGLEGIDDRLVADMKAIGLHPEDIELLPPGQGWLMAEFGGATREASDDAARACMAALAGKHDRPSMKLFEDRAQERMLWTVRESGLGATAHVPNKKITWEGWEDAAVAPEKLGAYLRDFRALLNRHRYQGDLYGHFGQGCVHTRIDFDLETQAGIDRFHAFLSDAADLVVRYGGSFSGEHGDGQSKAEFLPRMFGERLVKAFGEFKAIFDPGNRMNPGKIVHPCLPTQNLRLGAHYNPKVVQTHFGYPKDGGRFNRAILRCVGVGNCRSHHGGTMCPSYRATMEEKHSTRGRSRLLFEMMRGDVLRDGFKSEAVKDALHLCLSCKGCKGDCPVNVDMATYRAEFMAGYYRGRLRPLAGYAFGYLDRVARLAAHAPKLVNALTQAKATAGLAHRLLRLAPQRRVPAFAPHTFVSRFQPTDADAHAQRVLLWPDTFNNHFHPAVAHAAVHVLRAAGFGVTVPQGHFCCGRPLYEWGFLDAARAYLLRILDRLGGEIDAGVPFVVLEPACASVFRDEMPNLLPDNERARRLSRQTFFFGEFLDRYAPQFRAPPLQRHAIVHAHCHHKALLGRAAGASLLARAGLDGEVLDSGCCGMAGSFGFERDKYDVSMAVGEHVLLPRVRAAGEETVVVADGYSCREQIAQSTRRTALHPAQVLAMALGAPAMESG